MAFLTGKPVIKATSLCKISEKKWDVFVSLTTCVKFFGLFDFLQDTGISVRKRVIKIFREVFVVQPDFNKIPDMCVKMIRRVNDEDGIKVEF